MIAMDQFCPNHAPLLDVLQSSHGDSTLQLEKRKRGVPMRSREDYILITKSRDKQWTWCCDRRAKKELSTYIQYNTCPAMWSSPPLWRLTWDDDLSAIRDAKQKREVRIEQKVNYSYQCFCTLPRSASPDAKSCL